jgi:prepilin-type N-terminal cleavage/methylation domain-containing protein
MKSMRKIRRGLTLMETVLSLVVFSVLSLAGFTVLSGALNTDRYLRSANTTESEIELATRRITNNLRTAAAMSTPTTTAAGNTLSITTQPDSGNSNAQYTVSYSINSNNQLVETDSRYGAGAAGNNVLLNNVSTFSVQLQSTSSPKIIQVTLTTSAPQAISRSFKVYCRNL